MFSKEERDIGVTWSCMKISVLSLDCDIQTVKGEQPRVCPWIESDFRKSEH